MMIPWDSGVSSHYTHCLSREVQQEEPGNIPDPTYCTSHDLGLRVVVYDGLEAVTERSVKIYHESAIRTENPVPDKTSGLTNINPPTNANLDALLLDAILKDGDHISATPTSNIMKVVVSDSDRIDLKRNALITNSLDHCLFFQNIGLG
jgi:hypothetical protein